MEVLHPSVMAGVFKQSTYATEPLRRARNTLGYVLRTTFGNTEAATDGDRAGEERARAHRRHPTRRRRVPGARPRADRLGPHLHPVGGHGGVRPLQPPAVDRREDRYLAEQAPIGRMGGAEWVPESMAELDDYVERMRPLMAMNEQTREFIDFLAGDSDGEFRADAAAAARAAPRPRRVDVADADVGPPPHRHLPAGRGATALPRAERPPAGSDSSAGPTPSCRARAWRSPRPRAPPSTPLPPP